MIVGGKGSDLLLVEIPTKRDYHLLRWIFSRLKPSILTTNQPMDSKMWVVLVNGLGLVVNYSGSYSFPHNRGSVENGCVSNVRFLSFRVIFH